MYSAYKLNKQGDNIQPSPTAFPIWNQSVPCPVLTVASWLHIVSQEAGQVVWYPHLFQDFPQFIVIHAVEGFGIVNKAEVDVFMELSCFFYFPTDVGNLISGSSAFSKTSLNMWKFMVHVLLKPDLENFEHYFTSVWDECNCVVVWAFCGIAFLRDWNKNWPFKSLQSCLILCNPMGYSLPGSSIHGISQTRIPEWIAMPHSRGSSWPRDGTSVLELSCIDRLIIYH